MMIDYKQPPAIEYVMPQEVMNPYFLRLRDAILPELVDIYFPSLPSRRQEQEDLPPYQPIMLTRVSRQIVQMIDEDTPNQQNPKVILEQKSSTHEWGGGKRGSPPRRRSRGRFQQRCRPRYNREKHGF